MLTRLLTQTLTKPATQAICDHCSTVTNLRPVFNHEEGQLNYCCTECSEKLTKGFLFGIERQPQASQVYED